MGQDIAGDAFDPARHLYGGAPREREEHDPPGVGALHDQVGHAVCQGIGLAGAGAGDNEKRRRMIEAVLDGTPLFGIKRSEIRGGHRQQPRANHEDHQEAWDSPSLQMWHARRFALDKAGATCCDSALCCGF